VYGLKLDAIHGIILLDGVGLDIPAQITPASLSLFETDFGSDPKVWHDASPLYHVSPGKGIPPFLMFYAVENGEGQSTSQEMATALIAAGVENWLEAAQGRSHDTVLNDIGTPGDPVTGRIMEFIRSARP